MTFDLSKLNTREKIVLGAFVVLALVALVFLFLLRATDPNSVLGRALRKLVALVFAAITALAGVAALLAGSTVLATALVAWGGYETIAYAAREKLIPGGSLPSLFGSTDPCAGHGVEIGPRTELTTGGKTTRYTKCQDGTLVKF